MPNDEESAEPPHALSAPAERWRFLLEAAPTVVFTCEPAGEFAFTFVTPDVVELTGWNAADFLAEPRSWIDKVHPDDRGSVLHSMAGTGQEVASAYDFRFRRRDGEYRWLHGRARLLCDARGAAVEMIGSWLDATEEQRARATAREGVHFVHAMTLAIPDILYVYDIPEERNVYVNRSVRDTLGYTPEQIQALRSRLLEQLFHPEERELIARQRSRQLAARDGDVLEFTYRMRRADGEWRWLTTRETVFLRDAAGGVSQIVGVARDVTEQRHAEAALRASEERSHRLFESSRDCLKELDLDGRLLSMNHAGQVQLEIDDIGPHLGAPWEDLWPEESRELIRQSIAAARDGATIQFQVRNITSKGETRWWDNQVTPVRDETGRVEALFCASRDVTALRLAELDRAALERKLQQAQRLEALEVLAGGVAHDFSNLLTAVIGYVSLAQSELPAGLSAAGLLTRATEAAQQAATLCQRMLDFSGRGRFVVERVEVGRLVRDVEPELRRRLPEAATLTVQAKVGLPEVEADAGQLRQVLLELATNAGEALPEGVGTVTVAVGVETCDREALHRTAVDDDLPAGDYVWFEVRDDGVGMDPATQGRIFEPFFSTKFPGRGLGLAAALGVVRGHRGAVRVTSELGAGTTMRVLLPAKAVAAAVRTDLLLVEGDPAVRELARRVLEAAGFRVEAVEAAPDAAGERDYAVVVLDLPEPATDCDELLRAIAAAAPRATLVLTSGHDGPGILAKPYRPQELVERVRAALRPKAE